MEIPVLGFQFPDIGNLELVDFSVNGHFRLMERILV